MGLSSNSRQRLTEIADLFSLWAVRQSTRSESRPAIHYRVDGGVAWLTFDNPGKLNALTSAMLDVDLPGLCAQASNSDIVTAVVLTGAGSGFCSGADLQERFAVLTAPQKPDIGRPLGGFVMSVASMSKPVVAAINGAAAGGGLALALVADVRIASRDAIFAAAYARGGLVPDAGMTYTLPRLIGRDQALRFLLEGQKLDAEEAAAIGLIDEIVESGDLSARAQEVALALSGAEPEVVAETKRLMSRVMLEELMEHIEHESVAQWARIRHPSRSSGRASRDPSQGGK
jgi:2-(1,2-epoxy-1,2-dihydrophenyl)acetyl-CoA isomerase